ncbi:alpha/beta hydrolase [Streptomonospora salina]|uniref:Acetyl esterase/lipase n=1 Tax=Streptomonospora salina TaxID=104205 RepID=A0A841EBK4_9ACTN|nr:alpha/beta hydrolase [Streptomonospora salina]MBB6000366.1 acetyl esterase/lipase [Streptomonospora salina]
MARRTPRPSKHRRRLLPTGLAGLAAAGAAAYAARRTADLRTVAPQLRGPSLYMPIGIAHPAAIRPFRALSGMLDSDVADGVGAQSRRVHAPGGHEAGVRVYDTPHRSGTTGALLWIHGGGHVGGIVGMDDDLCSRFALELGVPVVSVDYRLAPEHPFPADLDDCQAALRWLQENAAALNVDPQRIAVGGQSAGGGLAASLAQRAYDSGHGVCFQLLQYPMLDDRTALVDDHGVRGRFMWTPRSNRVAWTAYLGHPAGSEEDRPYAVPARRTDLSGLPPAWIGVGDIDLFYEEDLDYGRRLNGAGVPCEVHTESGMYHGADSGAASPSMVGFRDRMVEALRSPIGGAAHA